MDELDRSAITSTTDWGLKQTFIISRFGGQKSEIKMSAGLVPAEAVKESSF